MPITLEPEKVKEVESTVQKKFYPNYRVLLHNDDSLHFGIVTDSLCRHIPNMSQRRAVDVAMTAHQTGVAEVIVCAQEHAEMYQDLLQNDGLTVTIEPVDP